MTLEWAIVLAVPAAVCAALIVFLGRSPLARVLVDHPNHRSLHAQPTPRLGGLGLLAGAVPVAAWFADSRLGVALACAVALAALSAIDDWRGLPVRVRLAAHVLAATIVVLALGPGEREAALSAAGAFGLVLALVWMTNLYNFMDGADGLAGMMATTGFGALAIAAAGQGAWPLAAACAAFASASAGFLGFNAPPARVFLGDAGSVPLGFLAGALGACGALTLAWPGWFPVLVFSPFIVDASVTIARRVARGERAWVAHRDHYYQRVVLRGWSPRQLFLAEAALMIAAAASALVALHAEEMLQCGILLGWSVLYGILVAATAILDPQNNRNGPGARQSHRTPGEQE